MTLSDNKPFLIGLIVILGAIKFILLPVVTWQETQVNSIFKQERQLAKGLQLLENKTQMIEELNSLRQFSEQQQALIALPEQSPVSYQLKIQKMIEKLLEKYQLNSRSSNWLAPVVKSNIEEHRLEIALSGNTKEFIQFLTEIEQQKPKLSLVDLRTNISKMYPTRDKLGRFTGKFTIVGWRLVGGAEVD